MKRNNLIAALLSIAVWWGLALLVNKAFLPTPVAACCALVRLAMRGVLWRHLGASLWRLMCALVVGFVPAAALGLAAGRHPRLNALLSPFIYITHPLPKAAFLPVIMLCMGLGDGAKIFLLAFTIFGQVLIAARDVATRIPQNALLTLRSLNAGPMDFLQHCLLPATLPDLFTALRVSIGTATAVLFLAETFATNVGLGFLIVDAWTRVAYPEMFAAIIALSIVGLTLFMLTDILERVLCPWTQQVHSKFVSEAPYIQHKLSV